MPSTKKRTKKKVKKQIVAYSNEVYQRPHDPQEKRRGLQIVHATQLVGLTGRDAQGRLQTVNGETPLFYLTIEQRNDIFRLSSPILGVVTSRMNRISGIDFNVEPTKKDEDKIIEHLKSLRGAYREYSNTTELRYLMIRAQIVKRIKEFLPGILPDLNNFDGALTRWRKRILQTCTDKGDEIKAWLQQPNLGTSWEVYIKKFVYDLMIHGSVSTYKQVEKGVIENFDTLPGGTVYKIRNPYFGGAEAYIQYIAGYEPQVFFADEMSHVQYIPTSSKSYSYIPLECLINQVSESLLFNDLMAKQADGTKPPEKLVIVTDNKNPFGDFDKEDIVPMDTAEQKREETKMNEPRKGAIMTFSGNDAKVIDLSRENTMAIQNQRQKDIREEVAMVFNMSNMEINLTGSDDTSGRSTSEAQSDIEQGKGITPILKMIENLINHHILPFRYGPGYTFKYQTAKNELKERQLDSIKLQNGEITVNENRERHNEPVFEGEEYNKPRGSQLGQVGSDEINPLMVRNVE
jgi:hypothetical protein